MILGDRRFLPGIASPRLTRAVAFLWPGVYEPVPRSRIHWPAGGAARLRVLAVTSARRRERPCVCGCAPCGRTLTLLLHADTGAGSLGRGATAFHWRETCHCPPGGRPVSVPAAGRAGSGFSRASPGLVTARPPAPLPALARPPARVKCCLTAGRASWGLCVPWQSSDRRHRRSCPGKGGRGRGEAETRVRTCASLCLRRPGLRLPQRHGPSGPGRGRCPCCPPACRCAPITPSGPCRTRFSTSFRSWL